MVANVVPVVKPLMLCEEIDTEGGLHNVYGLFNTLFPSGYPHTQPSFCVFAQLGNGLGNVACYFDIRRASDDFLIHTTRIHSLQFVHRTQVIRLSMEFLGIQFPEPGVYLIDLFCDNTWVADATVELREKQP